MWFLAFSSFGRWETSTFLWSPDLPRPRTITRFNIMAGIIFWYFWRGIIQPQLTVKVQYTPVCWMWPEIWLKNKKKWFFKKFQILQFFALFSVKFFHFCNLSLVIFDLQECAIPQIKAKDILFWPYFLSFLATINIFWERLPWSCLILLNLTS